MSSTQDSDIAIAQVDAAIVRPLRREILRPGQPAEQLVYPGDDDPGTLHLAASRHGGDEWPLIGIVSAMPDGYPNSSMAGDWRIRGMAVLPAERNRGIGGRLLELCEQHARRQAGRRLWCNARIDARSLYERIGMGIEGEVYEIPGIGLHYLMSKLLD